MTDYPTSREGPGLMEDGQRPRVSSSDLEPFEVIGEEPEGIMTCVWLSSVLLCVCWCVYSQASLKPCLH